MIRLVEPSQAYLDSYIAAYDEFAEAGVSTYGLTDARNVDVFAKFAAYRAACDLPPNRVGADYYWLVNDETMEFIGEISVRHELNDALRICGGHIGYAVRMSRWNMGWGTLMLKLALERAKARGIHRVLITCNDDNIASARVMEKNGLVLEDKVLAEGRLVRRYWKTL